MKWQRWLQKSFMQKSKKTSLPQATVLSTRYVLVLALTSLSFHFYLLKLKHLFQELTEIKERVDGISERLDSLKETVEDTEVSNSERFDSIEETLQKDKQNRVYFSAYDDEGGDVTGQLKFPKIVTNLGGAFDGSSGTFTAPVKGVYTFSFSGQQSGAEHGGEYAIDLYVRKNGADVFGIYDDRNSSGLKQKFQNINSIFSLDLNENDTVDLCLHSGDYLYAGGRMRLIFMGQLVSLTNQCFI